MASPATPVRASGNATILLYLSLFLLLLVFFIVLNAHSVARDYRVKAVMSSVGRSFAGQPEPAKGPDGNAAPQGGAAATAMAGLQRLGDLFETELAVIKIDRQTHGRLMVAGMAADDLFQGGSAFLRNERQGLLDRIARQLGDQGGVSFDMDFLISVGDEPVGTAAADPVARAAAMARALIADHAPPEAISVGIEPGRSGAVRFLFSAHVAGEPRSSGGGRGSP